MKDGLTIIGAFVLVAVIFFVAPVLGVLLGAFAGWVVSLLAPVWVTTGLGLIGVNIRPDQLVELGAALGFVGGFFKAYQNNKSKD